MDRGEMRELARSHNIQSRSIERALEFGVAEEDLGFFFDIRKASAVTSEDFKYTPSVLQISSLYFACNADEEKMTKVIEVFQEEKDSTLTALIEESEGYYDISNQKLFRQAYNHIFSNVIARECDDWFDRQAAVIARKNEHNDIDYEKGELYKQFGLSVSYLTESSIRRKKQRLLQIAFQEGFPPDFDQHPVTEFINEDVTMLESPARVYQLRGRGLRLYASLLKDTKNFKEELRQIKSFQTPFSFDLYRETHSALVDFSRQMALISKLVDNTAEDGIREDELLKFSQAIQRQVFKETKEFWEQPLELILSAMKEYYKTETGRYDFSSLVGTEVIFNYFSSSSIINLVISFANEHSHNNSYKEILQRFGLNLFYIRNEKFLEPLIAESWGVQIKNRQRQAELMEDYIKAMRGVPKDETDSDLR